MAKKKIIIGIHGLGNKPPKLLLEEWWRLALQEGLSRINCKHEILNFELVYWADVLHPEPLDIHESDDDDEDYLDERYVPASENISEEEVSFKNSVIQSFQEQLNNIIFNEKLHVSFPSVTDFVIKHFFQDLSVYFTKNSMDENNFNRSAKEIIRNRLIDMLQRYKDYDIFLIAHSMGTIIAYDVLMELENEIKISTFITIGSPIGVPFIYNKLKEDSNQADSEKMRVPNCITENWFNFADMNDKLAVNYKFEEMFLPNDKGVAVKSAIVHNDYESGGEKNPHKSFGYLRARQVSALVERFIIPRRVKFNKWIAEKLKTFIDKVKKRKLK